MTSKCEYVELLAQSNFSFLTGASHAEELIETSLQLGLRGLGLADVNTVAGLVRGFERYKALRPINFDYRVGSLLDLGSSGRFTFLAETRQGYGKITQWLSQWIQAQELASESGGEFDSWAEFRDFWQSEGASGVVCLPRFVPEDQWTSLVEIFQGHLYFPMVRYLDGKDMERWKKQQEIASRYQLPQVASNDVYYHQRERKRLQDVLLSIRDGLPLEQMGYRLFPNAERSLKSPEVMQRLFIESPSWVSRTLEVAERCEFQLSELRYYYPSEWIPAGYSALGYLQELVHKGAHERYAGMVPEAVEKQIQHELKLIQELHFADYFLTIYDVVQFARSQKILCQGRGSAANSVVCYVLGITAIDPVKMNLLFERFISAERGEPPDIDVDFEHERREEVIQYIYQKYGRHRAAMVCTHVCFRRRSALREVAKAFGISVGTLSARQLERQWQELVPDVAQRQQIESVCEEIRGFPRHASIHTGGFTLSAEAITRIVPVVPARMEGRTVVQWDKNDLETLGLLKVDILALGMLSALRKTLDAVGLQLHEVPHDDAPTYALLHRADTVGTFQVESRAQMSMLGRLQPRSFYDMVIQVAIVRPGPIVGRMVHPYLRRRRGWEPITFPHPKLKNILGRTLGVPLFQEQVMKLSIELADFSPGEADQLRRAIGAWRSSGPLSSIGERLMVGLKKSGLPEAWIEQIFEQIKGFAEYGFPESHAASFALLAYASCYLKCHHPTEFLCALINSQPMGFYRVDSLIYDGLRHGVKIKPVHIRYSQWDCYIDEERSIRLGFRLIYGLGRKDYDRLAEERSKAPFRSAKDFLFRTQLRESVLRRLVLAGRLGNARGVLWALLAYGLEDTGDRRQRSLFEWEGEDLSSQSSNEKNAESDFDARGCGASASETVSTSASLTGEEDLREWDPFDAMDVLEQEYQAFGYSTKGHPMHLLRQRVRLPRWNSRSIRAAEMGTVIEAAGMVLVRQKPPTAGGVVFATMEDEWGFIDICLPPEVFAQYRETFVTSCFLQVQGKVQRDLQTVSVKVQTLKRLNVSEESSPSSIEKTPFEPTQYFY